MWAVAGARSHAAKRPDAGTTVVQLDFISSCCLQFRPGERVAPRQKGTNRVDWLCCLRNRDVQVLVTQGRVESLTMLRYDRFDETVYAGCDFLVILSHRGHTKGAMV